MGKKLGSKHAQKTLSAWARIVGLDNGHRRRSSDRSVVAPTSTVCARVLAVCNLPLGHDGPHRTEWV